MGDNLEFFLGPDTCRLCLKSGRAPTPVSNENLEGSLMAIKIDILTSVKVAPSDKVCPMCRINVKNFYDFRIMCVQSDARVKGFAAKTSTATGQEDLTVKSDQVVRSYKRVRRTTDADNAKTMNDTIPGPVDLFKSTADLFKSKAEGGSSSGSLFKLNTKNVLMKTNVDVWKGIKRPLILPQNRSPSNDSPSKGESPEKSSETSQKEGRDPLETPEHITSEGHFMTSDTDDHLYDDPSSPEDPLSPPRESPPTSKSRLSSTESFPPTRSLSSSRDPLSSSRDPLSSGRDPLPSRRDALPSRRDPLPSRRDPLPSRRDPLSSSRDPLSSSRDPLSSSRDPLSSSRDPLSSSRDPLSSSRDPLSSSRDPLSSSVDHLSGPPSPEEEINNITVEPLSPAPQDSEDSSDEKEITPGGMVVKIENTLEDGSISDSQSIHNDTADSDEGQEAEDDTEKHKEESPSEKPNEGSTTEKQNEESTAGTSTPPPIKKELPDYDSPAEDATDYEDGDQPITAQKEEKMDDMELEPEEVIIPELKREPDDAEMFTENDFEEMDHYSEASSSFSGQRAKDDETQKRPRSDTESLEVLVDPLMLMHEDNHDAQIENKFSRLSPVLGNSMSSAMSNGKLALPRLNGSRTDKQRGLDFVKQLLRKKSAPGGEGQPAGGSEADKNYRCAICDITFAYYKSYMKHKERHMGNPTTYPCNLCPAIFATNRELVIHTKKHLEKTFACDKCYRSFPSVERLQAHYTLHTGDKPHACEICKRTFAYKSSVFLHMRKMHGEVITGGAFLRCPKCPTEWSTPQELKSHLGVHHQDEKVEISTFSCHICSLTFPSKSILNVHARIHQKPK